MVKTVLIGGVGDGHEVEFSGRSGRLAVPFLCGGDFCFAHYVWRGVREDGTPKMVFECEKHRDSENPVIFIGDDWEHRICRVWAATSQGIAFIAMLKAELALPLGGG
jgi:hypothetical protein